jgi:nitroimidazol reductase NimA-like FMN-containing flavoprotein (pyridoxamine 5'-phosphate oxidase superfamily)
MNRADVAHELDDPGAQELLRGGGLVRLAYNGPDGLPRVIPIGFLWTGDRVVVCTAPPSPKVAALSARPEVALSIDSGSTPAEAKSLLIRGVATLETVDGVPEEFIAAAAKSLDPAQLAEFEQGSRAMYRQMVRISIQPRWARFYDFGAGRVPPFLIKLAAGG